MVKQKKKDKMVKTKKKVIVVEPKKKVNFDRIREFIQLIDRNAGGFLFSPSTSKKTFKEKFFALTWPTHVFSGVLLIISTLVVSKFKLINVIFCTAVLMVCVTINVTLMKFNWSKDTVKGMIKWCESLYDVEKKWHPLIQTVAETHLVNLENRTVKYLKWFQLCLYLDAFAITTGTAIIGLILPESIYPKFSPPLPFYLPFKHQETWLAFVTNTAAQTVMTICSESLAILCLGFFFCIAMHIFGCLEIIEQAITEKLKQHILMKQMKVAEIKHNEEPQPSTSRLELSVLSVINQANRKTDIKEETSFNDWVKMLTIMILDVNCIVDSLNKLFSEIFLLMEVSSLCYFFFTGLIFIVVRQQYICGVGIAVVPTLLYVFCFINEKILEKFDDIKQALYDIPWYELTPNEQKSLLIMMNCDEIQKGFKSSRIHDMTIERFAIIMKAGYSNLLVLKDIIMK